MIARVFPRRTSATPMDDYAFIGEPGLFIPEDITEIHVSVAFTWDMKDAEHLVRAWERIAPVKMGGPAFNQPGGEFEVGKYLKKGDVITSRGCPNHCWFCSVPKREGGLHELEIKEGNRIFDDNLLACSEAHIKDVFKMLSHQSGVAFTGGLEAKLLKPWHVELIAKVKTRQLYFAYDTPDDLDPLIEASKILRQSEWYRWRKCGCYLLVGYPKDTIAKAEERCLTALKLGYSPFAMFYRDESGKSSKTKEWSKFQREWTRPAIINATRRKMAII